MKSQHQQKKDDTQKTSPTVEDYEMQENYSSSLQQQNQDDIMAELGNNTLLQGSDEWYDILKKGDDLLEKRDAYRMGKMGMLDGDDSTDISATAKGGGGFGTDVNLDANDTMIYTGQPGVDDGENQPMFGITPPEPMSEEEKLKREIEETFASIQGMTKAEKIAFMQTDVGKEYQQGLIQLEELIGALKYAEYWTELFGESSEFELPNWSGSDLPEQVQKQLDESPERIENCDLCEAVIVSVAPPFEPEVKDEDKDDRGIQINMNGLEYATLKKRLGALGAAKFLAEYVYSEYGQNIVDDRTVNGFIAEIYIHEYINSMIPDDFDYTTIEDVQFAEALAAWKDTGEELNIVYFEEANRQFGEVLADLLGSNAGGILDEAILDTAARLWMANDYRDRYGLWDAITLAKKIELIERYGLEEASTLF